MSRAAGLPTPDPTGLPVGLAVDLAVNLDLDLLVRRQGRWLDLLTDLRAARSVRCRTG